jgi:hypothetical protein
MPSLQSELHERSLRDLVAACADALVDLGVVKGDRVAI